MVSTLLLFVNRLPEEAREEECDKDMRKLVYLLGLLFFMARGEDAKEGIIPEPDVPYDYSEFGGYHVKDTVGYDMATLEFYSSNDTATTEIYTLSLHDALPILINADVAAKILGCSPQRLRMMARERPELLGFPVCCPTPSRVKIPRIPFMRFLGLEVDA